MKKLILYSLVALACVFTFGVGSASAAPSGEPATPKKLVATQIPDTANISLEWQDKSNDEDGFLVERSLDGAAFVEIASVGVDVATHTDMSVITGVGTYEYRVRAYRVDASITLYSDYSNVDILEIEPPATPKRLFVEQADGTLDIYIDWRDESNDEDGFSLERSINGNAFIEIAAIDADTVEYTDNNIVTGVGVYEYRIRSYREEYGTTTYSDYSDTDVVTVEGSKAPSKMVALQIPNTANISLEWQDKSNDEDGFLVERSLNGGVFTQIASVGVDVATHTDMSVITGVGTYEYRVRAYRVDASITLYSDYSNVDVVTIEGPIAPSDLAVATSGDDIIVTWTDESNDEDGFLVERSLNGAAFVEIASVGVDVATHTDMSVITGVGTYEYRVRAYRVDASITLYSDYSNVDVVTIEEVSPPSTPTNLTAIASGTEITLTWSDNSDDESGFEIERTMFCFPGEICNLEFPEVIPLGPNISSYTDMNLSHDQIYTYKIRAYKTLPEETLYSDYSNESTAVTDPNTTAPTHLTVEVASEGDYTEATLTWHDNSDDEDGFEIEWRKVDSFGNTVLGPWIVASGQGDGLGANTTSYVDDFWRYSTSTTPVTDGTYSYRVRAFMGDVLERTYTEFSNFASIFFSDNPLPGGGDEIIPEEDPGEEELP